MASLRDTVKDYQDELRDGIAWVAFWKEGHSWNAEHFHLEVDGTLDPFDRSRLEEIKTADPAAVILNGYYCGQLGEDVSLDELTAGVRYHYENSRNDIDGFIGAHDDRLPPEVIEEARAAAHEAGLPFSEKPYRDGEDFNPYVFDGSMSIEDFELMHRMIEKERSEQMAEPILSGYLSNLGKYTEGRPAGEWVTFPTTAEHLKEVFDRIGIDFKHYEEWHFTEFQSTIPGLTEHLSEYSHPDELNYLGKLLEMQFDDDREKFIAAIEYGDHADSLQDIINLAQNLDCYWIYPSVHNEEEYGRYLVDELEEPELPEEAKKYFMYEEYGRDASINDDGMFTEKGYIYNNRNTFTEWYDGRDVPEEYRVTPQPPQPERPDPSKVEMDAAAPGQRTAQTAGQDKDTFSIYQIKGGDETRDFRFEPYDRLQAAGNVVDRANYELVYSAPLAPETSLEDIYTCFNIDHPKDFKGHSLSVSDVVVLHQNGQDTAHFVDSVGFRQVPEFLQEQKHLTPDELTTGETIQTPRGTFHVTAMSREQIEAAGYGFHHQSDDGKYLIMGNGTRAFAVAAEQAQRDNPLKTAEQTTEQNGNMIDGIINNTPTVDELEAKVKAGEQISLVDLANAVKADKERGKEAKPEKKPSIRAQLRADKEKAQKKNAKQKLQDLERS